MIHGVNTSTGADEFSTLEYHRKLLAAAPWVDGKQFATVEVDGITSTPAVFLRVRSATGGEVLGESRLDWELTPEELSASPPQVAVSYSPTLDRVAIGWHRPNRPDEPAQVLVSELISSGN